MHIPLWPPTSTDARELFSEAVETAERESVSLTKHGRRQAVVLSAVQYDRTSVLLEDAEDLADADAAMVAIEQGEPTIPVGIREARPRTRVRYRVRFKASAERSLTRLRPPPDGVWRMRSSCCRSSIPAPPGRCDAAGW